MCKKTKIVKIIEKILIIVLLVSCSKFKVMKDYTNVDPAFESYVEEFIRVSDDRYDAKRMGRLTIGFSDKLGDDTIAVCNNTLSVYEIDVNRAWWKTANYQDKYQLMMHEIGHCALGRQHTDFPGGSLIHELEKLCSILGLFEKVPELTDYCPGSLMSADMINSYCIQKHKDYYEKELFKKPGYKDYYYYPKESYKP